MSDVPRILCLQPEIGGMFADAMDMLTLTRWRLTCKANYHQVTGSLRRSLFLMLNRFVPNPRTLLDILTDNRGVFGGEFALAFVLRDPSILPKQLDIFVSDYEYDSLREAILGDPLIRDQVGDDHHGTDYTVLNALRTLISCSYEIRTTNGLIIYIHRSYTPSSTAPISRASCTALSNFVTAHGFGCSHPLLTLHRRALLADQDLPNVPFVDHDVRDMLDRHGFSMETSPSAWPEYRRLGASNASDIDDASSVPERDDPIIAGDNEGPVITGARTADGAEPEYPSIATFTDLVGEDEAARVGGDGPGPTTRSIAVGEVGPVDEDAEDRGFDAVVVAGAADVDHLRSAVACIMPTVPQDTDARAFDAVLLAGAIDVDNLGVTTVDVLAVTSGDDAGIGDDYDGDGSETEEDHGGTEECLRHLYLCPSQGRFFGDRGSFVEFFDPLSGSADYCTQYNIAPFGPMVVWRVLAEFDCENGCDVYDDVLQQGATSIPVLIRRDPFGELHDIVSDRRMGVVDGGRGRRSRSV